MQPWMKIMQDLAWLTQLGVSITVPPLLCAFGAYWLIAHVGLPAWLMIPALVLGLGASAVSVWGFYRHAQRKAEKAGKKAPPAFNHHR